MGTALHYQSEFGSHWALRPSAGRDPSAGRVCDLAGTKRQDHRDAREEQWRPADGSRPALGQLNTQALDGLRQTGKVEVAHAQRRHHHVTPLFGTRQPLGPTDRLDVIEDEQRRLVEAEVAQ